MAENKQQKMQIIRGTTPPIVIYVKNEQIDLTQAEQIWVYIWQKKVLVVDKVIEDVIIDSEKRTITANLTQDDTLALKEGDAIFQIRLLTRDQKAFATFASEVEVYEVYKGGVIQ